MKCLLAVLLSFCALGVCAQHNHTGIVIDTEVPPEQIARALFDVTEAFGLDFIEKRENGGLITFYLGVNSQGILSVHLIDSEPLSASVSYVKYGAEDFSTTEDTEWTLVNNVTAYLYNRFGESSYTFEVQN